MEYYALTERRTEEAKKIRRETKDRDFSPRRAKEVVPRRDGMANNLTAAQSVEQLVLVTPKSTNTQYQSTKNISKDIKTMETVEKLTGKKLKTLICSLGDFLAKHFQSLENEVGSMIQEVRCSLKSLGVLNKNSHAFWCLRTSRGYYLTTKAIHSIPSLPRWMNLGMTYNGKCLTLKTSVSHRTENECSLSDILEEQVDQKYFLSERVFQKIKEKFPERLTRVIGGDLIEIKNKQ